MSLYAMKRLTIVPVKFVLVYRAVRALVQGQPGVAVSESFVSVHCRPVALAVEHDPILRVVVHLGGRNTGAHVHKWLLGHRPHVAHCYKPS